MGAISTTHHPDPARAADMARRYAVFTDIAAAMAPLWPRIEALQDIP